jgi:nitrite reductase (NADH) large subunit
MRFPAPGIDKAGIDCLRTYDDARDLRAAIQAGRKRMAVVGGGLLGLEAAYHLKLAGVEDVCVIEIAERLLPRQLDAAAAGILRTLLEERGLSFRLGAKVEAYEGGEAVSGLRLASGETIGAEGVLLSSGVSPETELAKAAGIACGRGISVDCFMRSFAKGVFAAGDAAEFEGRSWGIIPAALEQARAAARAMLGDLGSPYVQTLPKTSLKVAGIDLLSMGLAVPAPEEEASLECVIRQDEEGSRYEKFILREGILVGAILLGSKKNQAWAGAAMGKPIRKEDIPGL